MSTATVINDYVAYGLDASKPVSPNIGTGDASYYYATDTLILYCWTGASWTSIIGGGGSTAIYSNPVLVGSSADTGSFATMGNIFAPSINITVSKVIATFTPGGSSETFKTMICTIDGSEGITGTVGTSTTTYTSVGSSAVTTSFDFAGAALTANTLYLVALVRTDGSGTSSTGLFTQSSGLGALTAFPHNLAVVNARHTSGALFRAVYAQNSSAPTTVSLGAQATGAYMLTLKWS